MWKICSVCTYLKMKKNWNWRKSNIVEEFNTATKEFWIGEKIPLQMSKQFNILCGYPQATYGSSILNKKLRNFQCYF